MLRQKKTNKKKKKKKCDCYHRRSIPLSTVLLFCGLSSSLLLLLLLYNWWRRWAAAARSSSATQMPMCVCVLSIYLYTRTHIAESRVCLRVGRWCAHKWCLMESTETIERGWTGALASALSLSRKPPAGFFSSSSIFSFFFSYFFFLLWRHPVGAVPSGPWAPRTSRWQQRRRRADAISPSASSPSFLSYEEITERTLSIEIRATWIQTINLE